MKKSVLLNCLEKDFIAPLPGLMEFAWLEFMEGVEPFLCSNFTERCMGLVCDFTEEIDKVFTSVFPSERVLTKIINDDVAQAMLFVHHPSVWNLPGGFCPMNPDMLAVFRNRRVSIYNLHFPLDHYGMYSTNTTLARALGLDMINPFAETEGVICGVIGSADGIKRSDNVGNTLEALSTDLRTELSTDELQERYAAVVGHETRLYRYGQKDIHNNTVAVCVGGGNQVWVLRELATKGINVLVTGLTVKNEYSVGAHRFAKENGISLLGGTHDSSEKFACMAMCGYFESIGLPSEFVEDIPCFEDL